MAFSYYINILFITCLYIKAIHVKTVSDLNIHNVISMGEISTKCYEYSIEVCKSFEWHQSMLLFINERESKIIYTKENPYVCVVDKIFMESITPIGSYTSRYIYAASYPLSKINENFPIKFTYNLSHYLYLAKIISKQPYQSLLSPSTKPRPRSTVVILLMLLMCGDTGALINPGPINRNVAEKCSICVKNINRKNIFLSCVECGIKVHKKCENINASTWFTCNLCLYKSLPFNNFEDSIESNTFNISSSYINSSSKFHNDFNTDDFECFRKKGLHFVHANARSIFHKMSELKLIAKQTNAAVIAITETWLDGSYTDASVSIEGYNIIRRDRLGHAGGVCAYIRENLAFNTRPDLNNNDLEDLWFEILLPKSKPLYIGVCYRTSNNNKYLDCLESTLSKLRTDCDFVVLGDFNICLIKNKSKLCSGYKQLLNFFGCKQLIEKPTRITENSSSLLDHIFTNNLDKIYQSGVLSVDISDHLLTFCSRKIIRGQIGKHKTIKIRSLKNYSVHDFLNKLRNVDWSSVINCTNVNEAWENFKTKFINVIDEVAPIKHIRIKTRTEPWINNTILELIWERDKLLYNSNKNKENRELRKAFNLLRNKVQREIRKAKTNYFKDKIEENKGNPKNLWKQLKSIGYSSKPMGNSKIVLDINNESCYEPKNISDHINGYFLNIASNLVKMLPAAPKMYSTNSDLFKNFYLHKNVSSNNVILNKVTENFVNTELSRLNSK